MKLSLSKITKLSVSLALVITVLGISLGSPLIARADGSFIVNSSADTNLKDNVLTLREAILTSNGLTGPFSNAEKALLQGCTFSGSDDNWTIAGGCGSGIPDSITFHTGISQVNLTSCLPDLTDAGTTISGGSVPQVIIDASGCDGEVFVIDAGGIRIELLSIINTNSSYDDIVVKSGKGAVITGNRLGMQYSSTYCDATRNGSVGIVVLDTTSGGSGVGNGSAYIYSNIIGCHSAYGVDIIGADYVYIGVQPDGTSSGNGIGLSTSYSYPNASDGIIIQRTIDGADHNEVANNYIANNGHNGIVIYESSYNTIRANTIGLTESGTAAPNAWDGVHIEGSSSHDNIIGGASSLDRNIISGNSQSGVHLEDYANLNSINGNWIGTNLDDTGFVPNELAGIAIENGAYNNTIGDPSMGWYNFQSIKGNTREGVYIGDNVSGILVGRYNIITNNGMGGVVVAGSNSTNNHLQPGICYNNGGLPIDLGGDGHTANGTQTPPGPNNWMEYPEITSTNGQLVSGTAFPGSEVSLYLAAGDPSRPGGGGLFEGSVTADGSGVWSADLSLYAFLTPMNLSLVAYHSSAGSSEMSPRPMIYLPLVIR